jgi:hypothetical protein
MLTNVGFCGPGSLDVDFVGLTRTEVGGATVATVDVTEL